MKIYDKKGFRQNIITFLFFSLLTAALSYFTVGDFSYAPSLVILYGTFTRLLETLSEEKSKINLEYEQQKNKIMEKHFGKYGKWITNAAYMALILSVIVMYFNFIVGLAMIALTIIVYNTVTKPANEELKKADETATQKKQAIK